MNRNATPLWLLCLVLAARPGSAGAADHRDGPAQVADPATDLADLYAWMSPDGAKVYLALTLFPMAGKDARFSDAAYYVFHTASRPTFPAAPTMPVDLTCSFDVSQRVQCWVGADATAYVSGDARNPNGLRSGSGKVKVFTGLRRDPFFFNQEGFQALSAKVRADTMGGRLTFDVANCPALSPDAARPLREMLQEDARGQAPKDAFRGQNVLAIVVEVDKALLTRGGPLVSVWAAVHPKRS